MTDANLNDLDPRLLPLAKQFLFFCNEQFKTKITVTYRSAEDQNKAHAAGLSNASAGSSPHNCIGPNGQPAARAFDFACYDKNGNYVTNGLDPMYTAAGKFAETLGLFWAGRWKHPDYDHIQLKDWKTLPDLPLNSDTDNSSI